MALQQTFKTNINCGACIRSVTPFLNEISEIENWEVDIQHPDKILTVTGNVSVEVIVQTLEEAGYEAVEREMGG